MQKRFEIRCPCWGRFFTITQRDAGSADFDVTSTGRRRRYLQRGAPQGGALFARRDPINFSNREQKLQASQKRDPTRPGPEARRIFFARFGRFGSKTVRFPVLGSVRGLPVFVGLVRPVRFKNGSVSGSRVGSYPSCEWTREQLIINCNFYSGDHRCV